MKQHPPILAILILLFMACYLGWSLITGSLRIRGVSEPIMRQTSPREYWFYMRIILVIFGGIVAAFAFMFF
jgi:hypothetical protein